MTEQIRSGRRSAHNLYDSDGVQIGAMFTKEWGARIVAGYNAGTTADVGEAPESEVVIHLKRCGYVDPEDGCVPMFTGHRAEDGMAWTSASRLVSVLFARFEIRERSQPVE